MAFHIYACSLDRIRQSANRTRQMQRVNHRIANTNNNNNWHVQHCISKYTRLGLSNLNLYPNLYPNTILSWLVL